MAKPHLYTVLSLNVLYLIRKTYHKLITKTKLKTITVLKIWNGVTTNTTQTMEHAIKRYPKKSINTPKMVCL